MSKWKEVGSWLKNEGPKTGVALIGSLLSGGVPAALATGISLVSSATGSTDPKEALSVLQNDPTTVVKLKELAVQEEENIRRHIKEMAALELEDVQKEHHETQETIRNGDNTEGALRWNRPGMAWWSLVGVFLFIGFGVISPADIQLIGLLISPAWAYMGLRQIGKGFDSVVSMKGKAVK